MRALIVDDERTARAAVAFALCEEGFACFHAEDGQEALERIKAESFDLIVTDLRMPQLNGHRFASEVLNYPNHPLIVVHSAVDHPELTKDLIRRGVDDIVQKPTNYLTFAAKMRAMVERRKRGLHVGIAASSQSAVNSRRRGGECDSLGESGESGESTVDSPNCSSPVSAEAFQQRVNQFVDSLDVGAQAFEIYDQTRQDNVDIREVHALINQNEVCFAEIMRLANSSFYLRTKSSTVNLEQAVMRLGFRRTGEVALSAYISHLLTAYAVPWIDADMTVQRIHATTCILRMLLANQGADTTLSNLILCAHVYPLGRWALGKIFEGEYQSALNDVDHLSLLLSAAEASVFPESHTTLLGRLLRFWHVPNHIWKPINHIASPLGTASPTSLPASPAIRQSSELLQIALFLGQLAVGKWSPQEELHPPSRMTFHVHGVREPVRLVHECRKELQLSEIQDVPFKDQINNPSEAGKQHSVVYWSADQAEQDWLKELLITQGYIPPQQPARIAKDTSPLLIANGMSSPQRACDWFLKQPIDQPRLLMLEKSQKFFPRDAIVPLQFPIACNAIQHALERC